MDPLYFLQYLITFETPDENTENEIEPCELCDPDPSGNWTVDYRDVKGHIIYNAIKYKILIYNNEKNELYFYKENQVNPYIFKLELISKN